MENQTKPTTGVKGELTYEDKVIQKIVGIALESVDGLLTVDGGLGKNKWQSILISLQNMAAT